MIISRTPLRVSFAGGGTDIASYYRSHGGGAVTSAAIDQYVYVVVNQKFDQDIRVSYSHIAEYVQHVDQVKHPMVREAMRATGVTDAVEIVTVSDIPAEGTGLGSSSSFAVGILNALWAFKGKAATAAELAEEACRLEIEVLHEPAGKQDQYAAAFGGLAYYQFHADERVTVEPIPLTEPDRALLESELSLYFTGTTRKAASILGEQGRRTDSNLVALARMKEMAKETRDALMARDFARVGRLLDEGWALKKGLSSGISNDVIDEMHARAMAAGALGCKVTGAGGGGFLLVAAPPEASLQVGSALTGHRRVPVRLDLEGSKIIFGRSGQRRSREKP